MRAYAPLFLPIVPHTVWSAVGVVSQTLLQNNTEVLEEHFLRIPRENARAVCKAVHCASQERSCVLRVERWGKGHFISDQRFADFHIWPHFFWWKADSAVWGEKGCEGLLQWAQNSWSIRETAPNFEYSHQQQSFCAETSAETSAFPSYGSANPNCDNTRKNLMYGIL